MAESSRRTDASLTRGLALASETLAAVPAGLLTDFDGTLSPIVSDPGLATLVDGGHGALAALVERLAVVAIVTGRAPLDARRMTGVAGVLIAGNHGSEWLEPGENEPTAAPDASSVADRLDAVLSSLPSLSGVTVEHKRVSATIHYRNAPDGEAALAEILKAIDNPGERGIEVRRGRMSVELRPAGYGNKGSASRIIIERFGLRGVVIMGDDVTDLDMFGAVAELRSAGRIRGTIIGVGGAGGEVPTSVADASDVVLADPAEAAALLAALAHPPLSR